MFNYEEKITFSELEQAFNDISQNIRKQTLPKGFLTFILYVLSELFANIKEHSQTKTIFIALKINKRNCLIKISDQGIGFRSSYLRKKIYPKDDFAAIEFALSGLSTKDMQERGFGLYSIRKLIEKLKGKMIISSDVAIALIGKNQITFKRSAKKIRGVSINIAVGVNALDFYKIIR